MRAGMPCALRLTNRKRRGRLREPRRPSARSNIGCYMGRSTKAICLAGATAAVALTLYTGRHNASLVLKTIFAVWVMAPFAMLLGIRSVPRILPPIVTAASLIVYGITDFGPKIRQPAWVFLLTPAASLLVITFAALRNRP